MKVRELEPEDIPLLSQYWFESDAAFLHSLGVDVLKLPGREQFSQMLAEQLRTPLETRRSFCLIWLEDEQPVGHSNTNPTYFGEEAYMHLHLWKNGLRRQGLGTAFVQLSISVYFEKLKLKRLISEPYALNAAPNKTLEKAGFILMKEYITIPGAINYEQPVKRWELSREQYCSIGTTGR